MTNDPKLIHAIQTFLQSEGAHCQMEREEASTVFWSYILKEVKMTGFVSIHDHDGCEFVSASINFGVINPAKSQDVVRLLEENMGLHHGLSFASENERLVVLRFSEATELLTPIRLLFLLGQLRVEAEEAKNKFVDRDRILEPLPFAWFQNGRSL